MSYGNSKGPLDRRSLADLTNICHKRDSSSILEKFDHGNFETLVGDECPLKKGKTCLPQTADGKENDLSFLSLAPPSSNATGHRIMKADGSRGSYFSFGSPPSQSNVSDDTPPESEESHEDVRDRPYFTGHAVQVENRHATSFMSNEQNVGGLEGTGQSGEMACKEGTKATAEEVIGSRKSCSCSLCLKAAYMWIDLQYQDTKGRLAALKKSLRRARSLEGKFHAQDLTSKTIRDYPRKSSESEFDLMQRCRSLFLHTEDALVRESAQLHTTLVRLKDLREKCKRDLETISSKC